jgi:hypothetical protein
MVTATSPRLAALLVFFAALRHCVCTADRRAARLRLPTEVGHRDRAAGALGDGAPTPQRG